MTEGNSWKLLGIRVLGVWLALSAGACSHGEKARLGTADFASRFGASRDKAKDLEYPELLSKLRIKPGKDQQLPFDPTAVRYFAEADKALGLVDAERRAFRQNGFVMVDQGSNLSMGLAYLEIYKADLPVFVSADSILHALHRSYDTILMELEDSALIPNLDAALAAIEGEICPLARVPGLRESVNDLALFAAVVRNLLAGVNPASDAQLRFPPACGETSLNEVLGKIGRLQPDWQSESDTSLYGRSRIVDWSQFRPRGHYVKSPELEAYFRAMMWMGRADLAWNFSTERELRDAALLVLLARKSGQSRRLAAMSHVLDFMVGRADSSGLAEMEAVLKLAKIDQPDGLASSEGLARLRVAIGKVPMTEQQIRSQSLDTALLSTQETPLPSAFQLFGQRFVLDAFVLSKLVYDSIVFHEQKQDRRMPTGLDVMAALGSNEAVFQLEPEIRKFNYAANLLAARQLIDGLPKAEWQSNIYIGWLDGLRQLFPQPDSDQFPHVMRSREWQRKQLQTTLATWAELRHDTILYAKQPYSMSIVCEYPEGYVEPYPAFYGALKDLARDAAALLGNNDLDPPDASLADTARFRRRRNAEFFDGFGKTMDQLQTIALKELHAQPLDAEEKKFLKDVIVEHEANRGCGGIGIPKYYTGWYTKLYYGGGALERDPTVADVHTDPDSGLFLEEGVGDARFLVIAIDNQQNHAVYVGPAYSYYEFTSPTRLTDEEWERQIATTPPPGFTAGFVIPPTKRSMAYPAPPPLPTPPLPPTE
jgi:hypothetical protein